MGLKVKSITDIRDKWSRVSAQRAGDYEAGVKDPSVNWSDSAVAAKESYASGVQDAVGRGAFAKGVNAAGNEKWRKNTVGKGTQRWAPGIRDAAPDFETGFAPFRDALERVSLPPRKPRGDLGNYERVMAVGRALTEARLKQ